jgi:hypothetical protein
LVGAAASNYLVGVNLDKIAARFQDTVRRHGIGAALHDVSVGPSTR